MGDCYCTKTWCSFDTWLMMDVHKRVYHFALVFAVVFAIGRASEECVSKDACVCEYADGTQINLSKMFPNDDPTNYLTATKGNYTFYFHGCTDIEFPKDIINGNMSGDTCVNKANLCFFNGTNRFFHGISNVSNHPTYKHSIQNPGNVELFYSGPFPTTISLVCVLNFPKSNLIIDDVQSNQFILILFTPHACRTPLPHHLSTGSKLLIMFFTFGSIYLVGGMALGYFMKGARGREMIPNVDFWTSLPGLVKDGCVFIMGGCTSRMVSTAETYDQI